MDMYAGQSGHSEQSWEQDPHPPVTNYDVGFKELKIKKKKSSFSYFLQEVVSTWEDLPTNIRKIPPHTHIKAEHFKKDFTYLFRERGR